MTKPPPRRRRVSISLDPEIEQALAVAPEAGIVPANGPASARLHA